MKLTENQTEVVWLHKKTIYQVKDYADGWITFSTQEEAFKESDKMDGALVRKVVIYQ